VLGGRRRLSGFAYDRDRRTVAYVATSMTQPTELYVANPDGTGERKVTALNDDVVREVAMADAERFTYKSVGDLQIEGWLMKPAGYDSTRRYPLVLYIHGGPHSAYGENWFDEFQNLAGAGMMVLFTNPRGLHGLRRGVHLRQPRPLGLEDYQDLMKAVDLAAARPDVDSTRMGVTGGSYGGFMTAWITTKTDRFKAAQVDRMISDWTYWYGASDAQGLTEFEFFGKPWDNQPLYDNLSPIRLGQEREDADAHRAERGRPPHADGQRGAVVHVAAQARRARRVRTLPTEHARAVAQRRAVAARRPAGRLRQWFGYWLAEGGPTRTASAPDGGRAP
jgi:dipeptidyl aminopeptidase/acylaminoacyl peptidase